MKVNIIISSNQLSSGVYLFLFQKEILYLVLIEPKGSPDRDIVINDVLVREKLAVSKLKVPEHKKRNLNTKDVLKLLYQCEND